MRRVATLLLAALALTGCSGEQGERAEQLLLRAQAAQARLSSVAYEARVDFTVESQRAALVLDGGAYLKGRHAGDQVMNMRMEGLPGAGAFNLRMLLRGRNLTIAMNGRQSSLAVPESARSQYDVASTMTDLSRYVKEVRVREDRVVDGERGATVSGVLDTEGLLAAASKLQSLSAGPQAAAFDLSDAGVEVGDTRAALFVSERTGLIRSAVVTVGVNAAGKQVDLELTYRVKKVNRSIPGL